MQKINLFVKEQSLTNESEGMKIIAASKGYLQLKVKFEGEFWKHCKAIAEFSNKDNKSYFVPIEPDGTCMVDDNVTDGRYFRVQLMGVNGASRIVTNRIIIRQEDNK